MEVMLRTMMVQIYFQLVDGGCGTVDGDYTTVDGDCSVVFGIVVVLLCAVMLSDKPIEYSVKFIERIIMEKYFGNAYRGDPGVPHSDPDRFVNIWIGSAAFSALTWINPYMWQLSNQFNWHDKAMLYEQYHWKKALEKKQPYKFLWNQMDREVRDSYYFNWPVYFP
ncbi:unnamed protein product [Fraxinus pennsylvanica]|uniref:Uncharacterized protein n=1 Tax=Fraxinus pennsylvanica TaxID=56036 RepID=A0AAD2A8F6_9LAMI|nr:unnamed protein product [Fraxinus pennsylvanica]